MTTIAFFSGKGRVGATSLAYHLAWMYEELGVNVLVADLDPQSDLTGMFLDQDRLEALWGEGDSRSTVYGALRPVLEDTGDVTALHVERPAAGLGLLVGDLELARADDEFSNQWQRCLDGDPRAFRVLSALSQVVRSGGVGMEAQVVLLDVGPNLGAISRTALIAADHVVVPIAPDLYSFRGIRNLGPALRRWRTEWRQRRERSPSADLELPDGDMHPAGYVVLPRAIRLDRPAYGYGRRLKRIPAVYGETVDEETADGVRLDDDPRCLAALRYYPSLMMLAEEVRKPMFALRAADGGIGGHAAAVAGCRREFAALARRIADRCGIEMEG